MGDDEPSGTLTKRSEAGHGGTAREGRSEAGGRESKRRQEADATDLD